MKKIFIPLLCLLFVLCMAFPALAEEVPEATSAPVAVTETPAGTEATEAPPTVTEENESTVSEISDILKEWVPEILSAAALALTLVIAWLFRKGLLPTVTKFLTSIFEIVTNSHDKVTEGTSAILECLNRFAERMTAIEERLSSREDKLYSEAELISESLTDMSDTLTEIFAHTNLPAADKAMIEAKHKEHTEKIQKILATVTGGGPNEE